MRRPAKFRSVRAIHFFVHTNSESLYKLRKKLMLLKGTAFKACVRTRSCLRGQLPGLRKSSVLYQGTTLSRAVND
jgi:hypothetical protein